MREYPVYQALMCFWVILEYPWHGKYLHLLYQQAEHQSGELLVLLHWGRTFGERHNKVPFWLFNQSSSQCRSVGLKSCKKTGGEKAK